MIKHTAYSQHDVSIYRTKIQLVEQEIDFERSTFGHAYLFGDSPRVSYLLHDLRILKKQLEEIGQVMRQAQ